MILIHIILNQKKLAEQLSSALLKEKLLLSVHKRTIESEHLDPDGRLYKNDQVHLYGTTKALLFETITQFVNSQFDEDPPVIFATPIVYMDDTHANALAQYTKPAP